MMKEYPTAESRLFVRPTIEPMTLDGPTTAALIETMVERGIEVLVLDPLTEIFEGTENSDRDVRRMTRFLGQIQSATGAAIGLVHHARKSLVYPTGAVDIGQGEARGHTHLIGWPDTTIRVKRKGRGVELTWEKVRHADNPGPISLHFDRGRMILVVSPGAAPDTAVQEVLSTGPVDSKTFSRRLGEKLEWGEHRVREYRREMLERGIIEEVRDATGRRLVRLAQSQS